MVRWFGVILLGAAAAIEMLGVTGPGETDGGAWGIQALVMRYLNEPSTVSVDFFPLY